MNTINKTGILLIGFCFLSFLVLSGVITPVISKYVPNNLVVSPDSLKSHVLALTSTTGSRNYNNPVALKESIQYISNELKSMGFSMELQEFTVSGKQYSNIIADYGDEDNPVVIIGAHYDVYGDLPGADDNASGVAGLIEIARLLKSEEPALPYRIQLVFYSLEEPPFFRSEYMGSYIHAQSLKDNRNDVLGMIGLEMIGYYTEEKGSQKYPIGLLKLFYPSKGNFITVVGKIGQGSIIRNVKKAMKRNALIDVRSISAPTFIPGIDFSDHLNYWNQGYRAVMITNTAFYRNTQYHHKGDTPDRLDYDKMTEVVKGVYAAVISF